MSLTVPAVTAANPETQAQPTTAPPKSTQAGATNNTPQDTVTISQSSKQALANNQAKPSGDVDHDGDNH